VTPPPRIHVLCVDDEPQVLEGLCLHLRRRYDVATATSGAKALELLQADPSIAVVMSDMRMPGMDGAAFLHRAFELAPDATRLLLTGEADLNSAIAAVNEGRIFRFLSKPCPPPALLAAFEAGAEQHRLVTSERVLLQQTLHGSIKALTGVLALTSPASFGRATRLKQAVSELAGKLGLLQPWQLEVAAMLSQLGFITLPPEIAEKVFYGRELNEQEEKMVEKTPAITEELLGSIPRLEGVREILATYGKPYRKPAAAPSVIERSAQVLRVAIDFDLLETQGSSAAFAVETLRGRTDRYDPEIVAALAALRGAGVARDEVRELPLSAIQVGMVFAEDVKMSSGMLLVARGYEVTAGFLARARNFNKGAVKEPLRVIARTGKESALR
jgi:response regulator RpfG family c-di-GMP phosphodiesterase